MSAQPAAPPESMLDAEGRVAIDAPCVSCGYNLRTLKADAVCPECGALVARSLRGYFLEYASPQWVRTVARGSWLLVVVTALTVLVGLARIFSIASEGRLLGTPPALEGRIMSIAWAPVAVLMVLGLVLFTARDPGGGMPETDSRVRQWLRVGTWVYAGLTLVTWTVYLIPNGVISASTRAGFAVLKGPVQLTISAAIAALGLHYAARLMARIPRTGLALFSRVCSWGLLTCGILAAAGLLATPTSLRPGAPRPLAHVVTGCSSSAGLCFFVASFVSLIMTSITLSAAAHDARENAPGSPPGEVES